MALVPTQERLRYLWAVAKNGPTEIALPLLPAAPAAAEPRRHGGPDRGRPSSRCPAFDILPGELERNAEIVRGYEELDRVRRPHDPVVPARCSSTPTSAASTRSCASRTTSRACTASRTASASTTRRSATTTSSSRASSSPPSRRWPAREVTRGAATARRRSVRPPARVRRRDRDVLDVRLPGAALQPLPRQVLLRPGLRAGVLPGRVGLGAGRGDVALRAARASSTRRAWPRSTARTAIRRSSFVPGVDTERYHPPARKPSARRRARCRSSSTGGPSQPRNAFGLGLSALGEVKEQLGDRVEIVCAGREWNPGAYEMLGKLENLGVLPLDEVAELYRSCDIGLVLHAHQAPELPAARVHGLRDGHA